MYLMREGGEGATQENNCNVHGLSFIYSFVRYHE